MTSHNLYYIDIHMYIFVFRSQKFSADVSAGEEDQMEKEEPDFRGRDFEKQFACIFRKTTTISQFGSLSDPLDFAADPDNGSGSDLKSNYKKNS